LFSDNQDAIVRLGRAKAEGLAQDPALARMLSDLEIASVLDKASVCWVQGHAGCRGNTLADLHAREAAR
jgi:ribonuclease HI